MKVAHFLEVAVVAHLVADLAADKDLVVDKFRSLNRIVAKISR
jgi:hypothetical protein